MSSTDFIVRSIDPVVSTVDSVVSSIDSYQTHSLPIISDLTLFQRGAG